MDTHIDSERRRRDSAPERAEHAPAPARERWEVTRIEGPPEGDAGDRSHAEADRRKTRRRWLIAATIGLAILAAGLWYGWHWYSIGRYRVSTDDAYTAADNVAISPQVAGAVSELLVTDNQRVRKGDVLARIDDRSYRAQLNQSRADLASARSNVRNADAQIALQHAAVEQSAAAVAAADSQLRFAQQEADRYHELAKTGTGTVQRVQQADATLRDQQAALQQSQAALEAARRQLEVLHTQREQAEAAVQRAEAALDQARINLGYTTIVAPVDGEVGDRSVRLGQYVQPGTRLLTLVPMQDVYVVANFKETQLARMHAGQPVEIAVDAFPTATLHGRVDSLAPGSGSQFALLPPENATGNFTKIVQRVPVKIVLDPDEQLAGRLRPGLSVVPRVDMRDTKGKPLEERPPQNGRPDPAAGQERGPNAAKP